MIERTPFTLSSAPGSSEDATAVAPQSDPPARGAEQATVVSTSRLLFMATVIPHAAQEYETAGDYSDGPDRSYRIRVSSLNDEKMEFLVAIHELVEFALCRAAGIRPEETTQFDVLYERARIERRVDGTSTADAELLHRFGCQCDIDKFSEPGDDQHAPYYAEHQYATSVERMMAAGMGVPWNEYEERVFALSL